MKKIVIFLILMVGISLCIPGICMATSGSASNESTLRTAIENATTGDTVTLTDNIVVTAPIKIRGKEITIDGNGHTISANNTWANGTGGDQSLITVIGDAKVTLKNLNLRDSKKYGVQAYDGGYVILNGVNAVNNLYGGVLANGGTVEIIDLTLGKNGEKDNVGIEVGKQNEDYEDPKIIMNGKLSSNQSKNVIWIAQNDDLDNFSVENKDDTQYKLITTDGQILVVNQANEVVYASNKSDKQVTIIDDDGVEMVIVTIKYDGKIKEMVLEKGKTINGLDLEDVKNAIDGMKFVNFLNADGTVFDEETIITENIELTAVYEEEEKDDTVKTGVDNTDVLIAVALAVISLAGLAIIRK